ncbi:ATP-grasp domain-containing protein [Candidatus Saganbacteria bacterium]|nr:ATP-grasp domain-containing protein [Candidatus Saganbacteria bacterium]
MKKRIFVAGGGYADIPTVQAAKSLGYYVITGGLDRNGLANAYSDQYFRADNSDKEAILSAARELKVNAICPGAAGLSALSCSYAAEQMGMQHLDPYDIAGLLHHKDRFLKFAKENGISAPRAESFNDIDQANTAIESFTFPLMIKAADLSGGKGILKVADKSEAREAVARAFARSRSKIVVVEEYIEGTNHGFSTIIRNGRVAFHFADNEYYYLNKYTVAGACSPGDVPESAVKTLITNIEKISTLLKLKNGIFHLQFILKGDRPYIIDICRRIPGDLYVNFVKHAAEIDYPLYLVKAFAGLCIDDLTHRPAKHFITRHVIMADRNGRFTGVAFDTAIKKNIIDQLVILKVNDEITDFMTQRVGIVFLKFASRRERDEVTSRIHALVKAEVKR